MRPVITSSAPPPPRRIRPPAPDIPINLDFEATFDPVVTQRFHRWLVEQIATRAVELMNEQEVKQ